jgi:hypothetical protein
MYRLFSGKGHINVFPAMSKLDTEAPKVGPLDKKTLYQGQSPFKGSYGSFSLWFYDDAIT